MNEQDIILSVIENLNRLKTMNEEDRQMLIENIICDMKVLKSTDKQLVKRLKAISEIAYEETNITIRKGVIK